MTGNRTPGSATPSTTDVGEHGHPQPHTTRSRRDDSAPLGIGVKAKPAARVDLRSSLDPDPSPAFVRTEPGNREKPVTTSPAKGLTRPRSFRDDIVASAGS